MSIATVCESIRRLKTCGSGYCPAAVREYFFGASVQDTIHPTLAVMLRRSP